MPSQKQTQATRPQVSVVIASASGCAYLAACLEALHRQTGSVCAEIIVADCVGAAVTAFVRQRYPAVRLIEFTQRTSIGELRRAAILAAQGDLILITEDHCIPAQDWLAAHLQAHRTHPRAVIGGAVENGAAARRVDRAVYLCEYSAFAAPGATGPGMTAQEGAAPARGLAASNVSYRRADLLAAWAVPAQGYWETFLHPQLEAQGLRFLFDPAIVVRHKKHYTPGGFWRERFHYARWYAGTRRAQMTPVRRLVYLLLSPLLPPLILARLARHLFRIRRHRRDFVRSLPYLLGFTLAWALGECTGYAAGAGDSKLHFS